MEEKLARQTASAAKVAPPFAWLPCAAGAGPRHLSALSVETVGTLRWKGFSSWSQCCSSCSHSTATNSYQQHVSGTDHSTHSCKSS